MCAAVTQAPVFFVGPGPAAAPIVSPEVGGNKGANLARLQRIGLRVPPAVVLSTNVCAEYLSRGSFDSDFPRQLEGYIRQLEDATGLRMGGRRPLLVSVRSSPPVSMPGMLDTLLNVGLTDSSVQALIRSTGNHQLAWDAYRRLILGFANTVMSLPLEPFDRLTEASLSRACVSDTSDLDPLALRALTRDVSELFSNLAGVPLSTDPLAQLIAAIEAVCRSWQSPRAEEYRRLNGIDATSGTAVVIQAMVFGNAGGGSGSGVGFTRDPSDGRDELYVDFLFNAQGEDVVSGRRRITAAAPLTRALPSVHRELLRAKAQLEAEFRDMQDFEFTVQEGLLYFLQTRTGKRTPWAALRIATDLASAGLIDRRTALARLAEYDLDAIERTRVRAAAPPVAAGVPAGLGIATGRVALDSDTARQFAALGPTILVRSDISPDDIAALAVSAGVLTALGGRTSHGAVVARQLGKPCVVGCPSLRIDLRRRACSIGEVTVAEGDVLTIDGNTGAVYAGNVDVVAERPAEEIAIAKGWRAVA